MSGEKINKRKLQAADTRNKIYRIAKELFLKHGVENVSVDSIVEAAGISKGAFYVHFDTKDALTSILINDYVSEVDSEYKSYFEEIINKNSAKEIMLLLVGKIAEVIDNKIGYENMRILYKTHITNTIDVSSSISYKRDIYKMFSSIIEKGSSNGEFKSDLPTDVLSNHFILAMRGITYEWCVRYPEIDLKEQFLIHYKILLNGILI